jgi:hypothetical protein
MKVDLEYNIETMRITDPGEDAASTGSSPGNIMDKIKSSSRVMPVASENTDPETGEVTSTVRADVHGSRLKSMLAQIKQGS